MLQPRINNIKNIKPFIHGQLITNQTIELWCAMAKNLFSTTKQLLWSESQSHALTRREIVSNGLCLVRSVHPFFGASAWVRERGARMGIYVDQLGYYMYLETINIGIILPINLGILHQLGYYMYLGISNYLSTLAFYLLLPIVWWLLPISINIWRVWVQCQPLINKPWFINYGVPSK